MPVLLQGMQLQLFIALKYSGDCTLWLERWLHKNTGNRFVLNPALQMISVRWNCISLKNSVMDTGVQFVFIMFFFYVKLDKLGSEYFHTHVNNIKWNAISVKCCGCWILGSKRYDLKKRASRTSRCYLAHAPILDPLCLSIVERGFALLCSQKHLITIVTQPLMTSVWLLDDVCLIPTPRVDWPNWRFPLMPCRKAYAVRRRAAAYKAATALRWAEISQSPYLIM